jgi:hypothetical protein
LLQEVVQDAQAHGHRQFHLGLKMPGPTIARQQEYQDSFITSKDSPRRVDFFKRNNLSIRNSQDKEQLLQMPDLRRNARNNVSTRAKELLDSLKSRKKMASLSARTSSLEKQPVQVKQVDYSRVCGQTIRTT